MKKTLEQIVGEYNYTFPASLIAEKPAHPRDSARLLVYGKTTKKESFDIFSNIVQYIPKNAVLVFNQTKVWPARLTATKESGGQVQILYTTTKGNTILGLANKKLNTGAKLTLTNKLFLTVLGKEGSEYIFKPSFASSRIKTILDKLGKTPLPPYIKNPGLTESKVRNEYQTVFAKTGLSVAAPTASLHFTKSLITKLKKQGTQVAYVNLNVGLGTFATLTEENIETKQLHSETYSVPKATQKILEQAKKEGRPVIAVGTTVVRTLESSYKNGAWTETEGETKLFIAPGYTFSMVDGLITNFHVPKSSLLMLVSAFIGKEILFKLYKKAITKKFRLFSFGDGMLILP